MIKRIFLLLTIFGLFAINTATAQSRKGEFINASIGFGISAPYDDIDITGTGFYLQGEYVFGLHEWLSIRPYAGLVLTSADDDSDRNSPLPFEVTANAFLIGGKARVLAPIPWVAPYAELGIGASIGSFKTFTPFTDIEKNGLLLHIPFTMGVELDRRRKFAVEFSYYFHPSVEQFAGATAIGISFPLHTKKQS